MRERDQRVVQSLKGRKCARQESAYHNTNKTIEKGSPNGNPRYNRKNPFHYKTSKTSRKPILSLRRAYGKNYHTYVMDYFSDFFLSYFD